MNFSQMNIELDDQDASRDSQDADDLLSSPTPGNLLKTNSLAKPIALESPAPEDERTEVHYDNDPFVTEFGDDSYEELDKPQQEEVELEDTEETDPQEQQVEEDDIYGEPLSPPHVKAGNRRPKKEKPQKKESNHPPRKPRKEPSAQKTAPKRQRKPAANPPTSTVVPRKEIPRPPDIEDDGDCILSLPYMTHFSSTIQTNTDPTVGTLEKRTHRLRIGRSSNFWSCSTQN
jgi:hypothetical protein